MAIFIGIAIIFIIWIRYQSTHADKQAKNASDKFWELEFQSSKTRKQDISSLDYITIPVDSLPIQENADSDLHRIQEKIKSLSNRKILNLTGLTNTELKLKYGVSNLDALSEYDQNYMILIRTLTDWANYLNDKNMIQDVKSVLEFGISCGSDVSNHYVMLASIYKEENNVQKIDELIDNIRQSDNLLKDSIMEKLISIKSR